MSEGIINTQVDGTTIQVQHVNQYKNALVEDFLPRNLSGTNEDEAGSLGSDIYRWLRAVISTVFTNKLSIGAAGDESTNPSITQASNDLRLDVITGKSLKLYVNNVLKMLVDGNGVDGAYMKAASVAQSKLGATNSAITSTAQTGNTTSTTYVLCSSCQATLSATGNRPVYVGIKYEEGYIVATSSSCYFRLINTTTGYIVQEWFLISSGSQVFDRPSGGIDLSPAIGNNVYQLQAKTPSGNAGWLNVKLVSTEL